MCQASCGACKVIAAGRDGGAFSARTMSGYCRSHSRLCWGLNPDLVCTRPARHLGASWQSPATAPGAEGPGSRRVASLPAAPHAPRGEGHETAVCEHGQNGIRRRPGDPSAGADRRGRAPGRGGRRGGAGCRWPRRPPPAKHWNRNKGPVSLPSSLGLTCPGAGRGGAARIANRAQESERSFGMRGRRVCPCSFFSFNH